MHGHVVGPAQQLIERDEARAKRGLLLGRRAPRVVIEDLHREAPRALGHRLADAAEADDAERLAEDVRAEQHERIPALVLAAAHVSVALDDAARRRHKQRPREIRRRLRQHAGRVGHRDAPRSASGHVDMVVADRERRDRLQLRARREELRIDFIGQEAQQTVLVLQALEQQLARDRDAFIEVLELEMGREQVEALLRYAARNENFRLAHAPIIA